jgi:hypothetical protein
MTILAPKTFKISLRPTTNENNKILCDHLLTNASKLVILLHNSTNLCVPSMLIVTESLSFSSNLIVAALWNTMLTVRANVNLSLGLIANSGWVMSPSMGSTLCRSVGRLFLMGSKSCNDKKKKMRQKKFRFRRHSDPVENEKKCDSPVNTGAVSIVRVHLVPSSA